MTRMCLRFFVWYAWLLIVSEIVRWFDPAFLHYDGDSAYLMVCKLAGYLALLSVGMWPVVLATEPRLGRFRSFLASMFVSIVLGIFGIIVATSICWVIGFWSDQWADRIFRWGTVLP